MSEDEVKVKRQRKVTAKVNPNAVIKNLPEEVQEDLWQFMKTGTIRGAMVYGKEKYNINVVYNVYQLFYHWYKRKKTVERDESVIQAMLEEARARSNAPGGDFDDDLKAAVENALKVKAVSTNDVEGYTKLEKLSIARMQLRLEADRLDIMRKRAEAADVASQVLGREDITEKDRLSLLRSILDVKEPEGKH